MVNKNPTTAAVLGFLIGPFGYLYFGRIIKTIGAIILVLIIQSIIMLSYGNVVYFTTILWGLYFAWDCRNMALEINKKTKSKKKK